MAERVVGRETEVVAQAFLDSENTAIEGFTLEVPIRAQRTVKWSLRRIQERLYGCIDAAIDGQLCESFPESMGSRVVVQLDCYNVPQAAVQSFFEKFSSNVLLQEDYKDALQRGEFVRSIGFEVSFESSR